MTKKRNSVVKFVASVALAMVMLIGAAVPVFAAGNPITAADADHPVAAAITKILKMPVGTTTPTATFSFDIVKKSFEDQTSGAGYTAMPAITGKTVSYTSADTAAADASGTISLPKEVNLFAGVTWPGVGKYAYTVTETQSVTPALGTGQNMVYSQAVYEVTALVAAHPTTGALYIDSIAAVIVTKDTPGGGNTGDKVDPTPGGSTNTLGNYSDLTFTNVFYRTPGGPTLTDDILRVSKVVAGVGSDQTKYFPFSVTVTAPAVIGATTYKAYVLDNTNANVTNNPLNTSATLGSDANGPCINFTSGTPLTVNLKHNQRLVFIELPVGTTFAVTEQSASGYKPSCVYTLDGVTTNAGAANFGDPLATSVSHVVETPKSSANFTNTYDAQPLTGISMDNLPFILMIILLAAGVAGYVVVRSRRSNAARNM